MATTFKTFSSNDIVSTRTLLHEAIPVTGTIVSGTYGTFPNEENIKNYSHKYFQSVYDYPYLSSSANHIFDISFGYGASSVYSNSAGDGGATTAQNKKHNIYYQMAQVLMGHESDGTIKQFKVPGSAVVMDTAIFVTFSRLLVKDEIKKGSFNFRFCTSSAYDNDFDNIRLFADTNAANNFYTDSPAGEYAILTSSTYRGDAPWLGTGSSGAQGSGTGTEQPGGGNGYGGLSQGLLFYQAGIMVLTGSRHLFNLMTGSSDTGAPLDSGHGSTSGSQGNFNAMATGSEISEIADAIRHRVDYISFNNTTELNSTIHFCRVNHNDFNYSANPTYLSASKIRIKDSALDQSATYVTTIGLYSADNELLAAAKLSEPLKKTPDNEMTLRVRLDY
tara:strand:+ start:919 stop:2088 length:1170 start_codon:yes stop_codon:yes gene_type:complete